MNHWEWYTIKGKKNLKLGNKQRNDCHLVSSNKRSKYYLTLRKYVSYFMHYLLLIIYYLQPHKGRD